MLLWLTLWYTAVMMAAAAQQPPHSETRTSLSGQVELPRLVDLCAERLGLNIEYDAQAIRGMLTLLMLR